MAQLSDAAISAAEMIAATMGTDVFLFNGGMERARVLECIDTIHTRCTHSSALLILVTNGGDPDAAYKIGRYMQERYDRFSVLISGYCKSAGTLLAIGAQELIFTPFGELGPLDIQLTKIDRFDQLQSGLTIKEALDTLEARALKSFYTVVQDYISANNGLISFGTVSKAASDFVTQLYAPVFSRIDPEEIGGRSRSMRIAIEYGKRLAIKGQNIRPETLRILTETYPSHSFAIDMLEAQSLFQNVRSATEVEQDLVAALGMHARFEVPRASDFVFRALTSAEELGDEGHEAEDHGSRGTPAHDGDSARPDGTAIDADPPPRKRGRGRRDLPISPPNGGGS